MQVRDFTLRQLATFVQAARAGSFAKAADQLGISQPAVSDHIATLERRIGRPLFIRRRGASSQLTEAGTELLRTAEMLLDASASMRTGQESAASSGRVPLRMCVGAYLRDAYLKPLLPRLYSEFPDIDLVMIPMAPLPELREAMAEGEIDLILCTVGQAPDWPGVRLISNVRSVLVGAPHIAREVTCGAIALNDLQFIIPATGRFGEHWLERQLSLVGISPRQRILHIEFPDVIQAMVEQGRGVTVLMHEQVTESIAAGKLVVFGPEFPPMQRILIRSARAPERVRAIEQFLIEALNPVFPQGV